MIVPIYGGISHGLQPTWQDSPTFIPKARSHYTSTHVEIHGVWLMAKSTNKKRAMFNGYVENVRRVIRFSNVTLW